MMTEDRNLPKDLARRARDARSVGDWSSPSSDLVARLLGQHLELAPPRSAETVDLIWDLADVRSVAAAASEEALHTRVFSDGELGLRIQDSADGTGLEVRGRIWLRSGGSAQVLLLQDDHVLAAATCKSGGEFRFEEVLAPGWELKVHPPGGRVVRIGGA